MAPPPPPPPKAADDGSPKGGTKIAKSVAAGLEAKADVTRDLPFAFTTFSAPPPLNAKNAGAAYVKTEKQSWSVRKPSGPILDASHRAAIKSARQRKRLQENGTAATDGRANEDSESDEVMDEDEQEVSPILSNTIVIHPGSGTLRLGLATDLNPISLPNCIARRDAMSKRPDEDAHDESADPNAELRISESTESLRADLRSILRNMKLRGVANGKQQASNYNASVVPETLEEHQDVFAIEWTDVNKAKSEVLLGDDAETLPYFSSQETKSSDGKQWKLFHPFRVGHLNFEGYARYYGESAARATLLNDVDAILTDAITSPREIEPTKENPEQTGGHGLGIPRQDWKHYTVALVIPDLYLNSEIEAMAGLLLNDMGFAGIVLQQESVCATFGAGQSSACVVAFGPSRTSVTCVDEGLAIADSRQLLGYGGQQCSEFFMRLLRQANFPYKSFDMNARLADKWLADELKARLCTMDPFQLGLIISDFHVRLPGKRTQKFALRTYDEVILGVMGLFNPRVFSAYAIPQRYLPRSGADMIGDDDVDGADDGRLPVTGAMRSNIQHLLPHSAPEKSNGDSLNVTTATASGMASKQGTPAPAPATHSTNGPRSPSLGMNKAANGHSEPMEKTPSARGTPAHEGATTSSARASPVAAKVESIGETEKDAMDAQPSVPILEGSPVPTKAPIDAIDIASEASKTQLDLAVWNSIVASASSLNTPTAKEERIKRMVTNILCTGGTALLPALGSAIEARLNNYIAALWTAQDKDVNSAPHSTVVPAPRDMDPCIVPWKGMAVLTRLDNVTDLWVLRDEWNVFGMRALRERTYFMP